MIRALIDANLLLLLVVGSADRLLIPRHQRLSGYSSADYDLLVLTLSRFGDVVTCPNAWTEVSNLLRPGRDRSGLLAAAMRGVVASIPELYVPSVQAVGRPEFAWLGLTDTVLLSLAGESLALLTADLPLAIAAESAGLTVVNFRHLQSGASD